MIIDLTNEELLDILQALPNAAALYEAMALKEKHPLDRKNIAGYGKAARDLYARFTADASPELTPGELAVLERALRFEMARWQQMIVFHVPEEEKARLRGEAEAIAAIIVKLRTARGIPC